jgi:mono/diheme cytochrome c family protein
MPFHNVSESDMQAIISYLRTQKPVKNKVPDNEYNVMGKIVKAFLLKPTGPSGSIPDNIVPDTSAQYGGYLINYVGNCGGCHTQRDMMTGAYIGEHMAGGNEFDENGTKFITPNLTTDSSSRIFGWTYNNFKKRFRLGKLVANSPMPWDSYKRMTDDELKAIYNYLQTVKPAKLPIKE